MFCYSVWLATKVIVFNCLHFDCQETIRKIRKFNQMLIIEKETMRELHYYLLIIQQQDWEALRSAIE